MLYSSHGKLIISKTFDSIVNNKTTLLTKITTAQNEFAHSYHRVRRLYFLAVVFAAIIINVTLPKEARAVFTDTCVV